jgi:hypothetical protein
MHLRKLNLHSQKELSNRLLYPFLHLTPGDIFVFLIELLHELVIMNLREFSAVIHDRKVRLIAVNRSLVQSVLVVGSSDPENVVQKHLKRLNLPITAKILPI